MYLGCIWNVSGIYPGCIWNVSGCIWNVSGCIWDVSKNLAGYFWDVFGTYLGCIWDVAGIYPGCILIFLIFTLINSDNFIFIFMVFSKFLFFFNLIIDPRIIFVKKEREFSTENN